MNALTILRKRKPEFGLIPLDLDQELERAMRNLEATAEDLSSAPMVTPLELAEQRLSNFIADEEAAITLLQRKIAEREALNQADRDEIAQRKAAIALYRGDQIKPKGRAGK